MCWFVMLFGAWAESLFCFGSSIMWSVQACECVSASLLTTASPQGDGEGICHTCRPLFEHCFAPKENHAGGVTEKIRHTTMEFHQCIESCHMDFSKN